MGSIRHFQFGLLSLNSEQEFFLVTSSDLGFRELSAWESKKKIIAMCVNNIRPLII